LPQKFSPSNLFSDFEGTVVLPEVSYKEWVSQRIEEKAKFESEWEKRLQQAKKERTVQVWERYLDLYSGLFTLQDFKDISAKYSLNKVFESWCARFLKAHNYEMANLTIVTRGFAPIARHFFGRQDTKRALDSLKISLSAVIGSEPFMDKRGVMKGLKSVIYLKKKFIKDGHIMLGDEGEEIEFASYPYFVNLAKWRSSEQGY
jgi:hypothetical protein